MLTESVYSIEPDSGCQPILGAVGIGLLVSLVSTLRIEGSPGLDGRLSDLQAGVVGRQAVD